MAIPTGTRLGSYEIRALIGAGGMGEVYQANDTKLGRDVAIKVLPEQFASDSERLARFQREAKILASLNHPNIATIHGLEQSGSTHYLVMELVPGETLAQRIQRDGAVPVGESLTIAKQIAEALEAAHESEKGIIHRDLKPANVKITPEGRVKVLDFGLAKAFANDAASGDLANSPTLSALPTIQGAIMGTAAYMSPEQARGKLVDKRTDIWAFGCVLYELLTGKQSFRGQTLSDTIAAILEREPDWQTLPPSTSATIRNLLRRCLQKDRSLRLRDIGDARIEIEEALAAPATAEPVVPVTISRARGEGVLLWGLGAVLLAAITGLAIWNLKPSPVAPRAVTRTVITLPPGDRLMGPDQTALALSPDGTYLAYAAIRGGTQQLYLRALDSQEARPILGTEGAAAPFFSPDGQWLGFFAGGKLKKISVSGGAAVTLADALGNGGFALGGSWSSQGMIAYSPLAVFPLQQLLEAGGAPQPLTRMEKGDGLQGWPAFLPGGKAVLFSSGTAASSKIAVHSIVTGDRRDLIPSGSSPTYAASGHLIYAQAGTLMAVPFDAQRLEVKGTPVPVVEGVAESTVNGATQYSISDTGSLAYITGGTQANQRRIVWVSRNGTEQPLPAAPQAYQYVRLSPDGRRVAVELDNQIWLYDLARDTLTRFTFEGSSNQTPTWTPDGKRIAFFSNKAGGATNIYWQMADGSGGLERLTTSDYTHVPRSFSPDGQLLAFHENNPKTSKDIWVLRLSDRKAQPFLQTPFIEGAPTFSPDGHWLAYASNESGRPEVYVQPYPGPGGKWQISTEGGTEPAWNHNGRELFYRSGDKMMALDVATQPSFSAGKPHLLFERPYFRSDFPLVGTAYDVSADGQRFLMVKETEPAAAVTQINVVLNWFEELKRRVPAGTK